MHIDGSKLLRIATFWAISGSSFLVWSALYAVNRWWFADLAFVLPWVRALRWITYFSGGVLGLVELALGHMPIYGFGIQMFSLGLQFPERWLKNRFTLNPSIDPPRGDASSEVVP